MFFCNQSKGQFSSQFRCRLLLIDEFVKQTKSKWLCKNFKRLKIQANVVLQVKVDCMHHKGSFVPKVIPILQPIHDPFHVDLKNHLTCTPILKFIAEIKFNSIFCFICNFQQVYYEFIPRVLSAFSTQKGFVSNKKAILTWISSQFQHEI